MPISIAAESPLTDDVRALVAELNEALLALTPPEHCYHMTLEEMAQPDTTVLAARDGGEAIVCGALKRHPNGMGEVKRMFTRPERQREGLGGRMVEEIERPARAEGLTHLVLETGNRLPAAWRVYERAGFRRCGPVLDHPDTGSSVFYEKPLAREPACA